MFQKDKLAELLEEPDLRSLKKEVHAPFSLESLIAWLEKQNPREDYPPGSIYDCLLCRYGKAHGIVSVGGRPIFGDVFRKFRESGMSYGQADSVTIPRPHTFGAALTRALAALERL